MRVCAADHPDAETARTRYRTLSAGQGAALVELHPETGRMHQLRVHLASIGHPIAGDSRYGGALMLAGSAVPAADAARRRAGVSRIPAEANSGWPRRSRRTSARWRRTRDWRFPRRDRAAPFSKRPSPSHKADMKEVRTLHVAAGEDGSHPARGRRRGRQPAGSLVQAALAAPEPHPAAAADPHRPDPRRRRPGQAGHQAGRRLDRARAAPCRTRIGCRPSGRGSRPATPPSPARWCCTRTRTCWP